MIICYLNIIGVTVLKMEADSPLIINRYGILTLPIPLQSLEAIAGRNIQIIQAGGQINIFQTPHSPAEQIRRKPLRLPRPVEPLGVLIGKSLNHNRRLNCHVTLVK
jgi:hypothetical protein